MTKDEKLEQEAYDHGVDIIEKYKFDSPRLRGLYSDNMIALSRSIHSRREKACVLAEELGHYHTTVGDIISQQDTRNRKQELRARLWAYDKQIGLLGIIDAYKYGCRNTFDMSEYLDVTEDFLKDALRCYRSKYGEHTVVDNYIIYFEPNLGVMEMM